MDELIKWIIENKELAIMASIALGITLYIAVCIVLGIDISIPIKLHIGKKETNKIIINYVDHDKKDSVDEKRVENKKIKNPPKPKKKIDTSRYKKNNHNIQLSEAKLYATGIKGKVYIKKFRKLMNYNFGIEITLINNTDILQNAELEWSIYKNGKEMENASSNRRIKAHHSIYEEFCVNEQVFKNLKPGEYESQFFINNRIADKRNFTITDK